ncbi:MAG: class I SAM-dependent methyltransferase [Armatimonadota bacterium]
MRQGLLIPEERVDVDHCVEVRLSGCTRDYSQEFKRLIVDLHRGKEGLPAYEDYIAEHMGGPDSRLGRFETQLYPEIRYHCGDLSAKRVLDFGCGTGSATAALAPHCERLVAFDIDEKSVAVCLKRLEEHRLLDSVRVVWARDFEEIAADVGTFDFILLHAVLEHLPLSIRGLRRRVVARLFDALNPGGHLYINETPNRLWPKDSHTTGLWWIPWSSPGSMWAYARAVRAGQHIDNPATHSDGPLGLEERGAWGATFFEIVRYLRGRPLRVVNGLPGHDRHVNYTGGAQSWKRRVFESVIYHSITRWTRVPITAAMPMISNLVIQKPA